jgi:hypothetical protein
MRLCKAALSKKFKVNNQAYSLLLNGPKLEIFGSRHRVGRVLSFLQSSELGLPQPLTRSQVYPLPFGSGGRGTLAFERGRLESPNSSEGTYTVVLCIYVLCGSRVLHRSDHVWVSDVGTRLKFKIFMV